MQYIFNAEIRFAFAVLIIRVWGMNRGNWGTLGENNIENSADLPENLHNDIYTPHENESKVRFPIFIPLYSKEGYAGYGN